LVHTFSFPKPFLNPALFKDRNFVASNIFIFLVGVILFATLALLPPLLQNQLQYPVILTGLVTAPRGLGTLLGMMVVGRLLSYIDARYIIAVGLALTAYSLWEMTQFSLLMNTWPILVSGVAQGLGVGLVYVPLSTVAFTTLPAALRNEGTAFFNLLRNVGSSIGISVVMFLLTQNTQRLHASLAEHITPFNIARNPAAIAAHVQTNTMQGLAGLDAMVTNQATLIGYIDDFQLMMVLTLATIPFLFLIKRVKPVAGEHSAVLE
jgi:DHA2 family multidrug resistance protein